MIKTEKGMENRSGRFWGFCEETWGCLNVGMNRKEVVEKNFKLRRTSLWFGFLWSQVKIHSIGREFRCYILRGTVALRNSRLSCSFRDLMGEQAACPISRWKQVWKRTQKSLLLVSFHPPTHTFWWYLTDCWREIVTNRMLKYVFLGATYVSTL